jgi:hypothetical protein
MKIAPVKINIKKTDRNRRKFASIALTIDRDEFLDEVKKIRETFRIDHAKPCPHFEANKQYFENLLKSSKLDNTDILRLWFAIYFMGIYDIVFGSMPVNKMGKLIFKPNGIEQEHKNTRIFIKLHKLLYKNDTYRIESLNFRKAVMDLRKKLDMTPRMDRVIAHAILCNLVKDDDLPLAHAEVNMGGGINQFGFFKSFEMHIALEATIEDVLEAYKRDIMPKLETLYGNGADFTLPVKTFPSIYKDRDRYWKNKGGLGHVYIAAEEIVGKRKYVQAKKELRKLDSKKDESAINKLQEITWKVDDHDYVVKKSIQTYKKLLHNTVENHLNN